MSTSFTLSLTVLVLLMWCRQDAVTACIFLRQMSMFLSKPYRCIWSLSSSRRILVYFSSLAGIQVCFFFLFLLACVVSPENAKCVIQLSLRFLYVTFFDDNCVVAMGAQVFIYLDSIPFDVLVQRWFYSRITCIMTVNYHRLSHHNSLR